MKIQDTSMPIKDKNTKSISYVYYLEDNYWHKYEYDDRSNVIYYEDSYGI